MSSYRVRRRRQFCTFTLGSLHIGLPVEQVQEILRPQDVTTVPLVDPVVHGLINLRGQIVTAIDLRVRLQLPARDEGEGCMNVVINHLDEPISLLVDVIGDVVEVSEDNFELPPESLTGTARELVLGAYKLDNKLLLVLDIERAISLSTAAV
jgi:purine-binding chemotaxis protein CheW